MARVSRRLVAYSTIGTLLGVVVTLFAIRLAGHADGAALGHPVYLPLLYPYSILMFLIPGSVAFALILALCACQFPIYGLILGDAAATSHKRLAWTALWIGLIHGTAVAAYGLIAHFS